MDSALLAGRARARRVVFEFTLARAGGRSATTQDDDPRVIVASLSAAMAALFPTLHRDGLLLVTFQCPDEVGPANYVYVGCCVGRGVWCEWREGDVEVVPIPGSRDWGAEYD
ncbi:hypothetical protein L227DRAFT_344681 [Lentinus tigrinus ALCF2SS1-6]|uniref:Uncharacterized protein n=1 Tax=Lentinus tigrinus ALCF2SS1-6 TaxID=1328759 RepID=A0A5C2RTK1_9APHY|nr:hypothetical protein L227DRAFT_344681 [Lentinus tigrinus ALCF2SS1-6]